MEILDIVTDLVRWLNTNQFPERMVNHVKGLLNAERAAFIAAEGNSRLPDIATERWGEYKHSMTVVYSSLEHPDGYSIQQKDLNPTDSVIEGDLASCIAATILLGTELLGYLYCDSRHASRRFVVEDGIKLKKLAQALAPSIALYASRFVPPALDRRAKPRKALTLDDLVGTSVFLQSLRKFIVATANMPTPVLLTGEKGTGKDIVARLLHNLSHRARTGKFVPVNCAAIVEALAESEFFGNVKGAFTGATSHRVGLVLEALHGTLFLDEIGIMSSEIQGKLLRTLDTGEVRAVGDNRIIEGVDFRLISATNRDLESMSGSGKFLPDLLDRIRGRHFHLIPLRERPEDIGVLAEYFSTEKGIDPSAIAVLREFDWPGNIRQLRHVISNAAFGDTQTGPITKNAILQELEYQNLQKRQTDQSGGNDVLIHQALQKIHRGELDYEKLKFEWRKGVYRGEVLKQILEQLYEQSGKKTSNLARALGLGKSLDIRRNRAEQQKFQSWITYLRNNDFKGENFLQ